MAIRNRVVIDTPAIKRQRKVVKKYRKLYDTEYTKLCNMERMNDNKELLETKRQQIVDQIMLGDVTEALKMLLYFEKLCQQKR